MQPLKLVTETALCNAPSTMVSSCTIRFSIAERLEYLRAYGNHTMAYSLLQRDMEYFDLPHIGFLGYRMQGATTFVLANPICADHAMRTLLEQFLAEHPKACFVQITEPVSSVLRDQFQYYPVQMGVETWLDGNTWNLQGKDKSHLRRWLNSAKKAGLTVTELGPREHLQERHRLHEEWLQSRTKSYALRFLTRESYRASAFAHHVRTFAAYKGTALEGIVEFDPIFNANTASGYYVNLVQFATNAPHGTSDVIIEFALAQFMKEDSPHLSFGMSPLAKLSPCANEPPFVRAFGNWLYRNANALYSFKGNYFHKEKYRGEELPVFFATKHWNALPDVIRLFRLVGIV